MFSSTLRFVVAIAALVGATSLRASLVQERSVGSGRVSQISRSAAADLVLLDAGYSSGLRQGMVCVASRDGDLIGELLLVDLRSRSATALILDLASGRGLQLGDHVAVKTVSSRN